MAARGVLHAPPSPQQQSYSDLLLKTYENQLFNRYSLATGLPSVAPALYNPVSFGISSLPTSALGLRSLAPLSVPIPPPGTFQHLLASMTSSAAKARENLDISSPVPGMSSPTSGLVVDNERRSSSIAALRMKAREHELRLGISGNIVY